MTGTQEILFKPVEIQTRKGRTLLVRASGPEDFPTLVQMYASFEPKRVAQGLPPPDVLRIARWLEQLQNKSFALLALDGPNIAAHVLLCPIQSDEAEYTVFVLQGYREEGLGTLLSRLALAWAFGMGFTKVLLTTEFSNYRAIGLFRKLGFSIKSSYGDECEMKIDLPPRAEADAA